jgi:putative phosphoserine phosphatase/1-acylglycerol-3-phosphate O-acyltransferase
MSAGIPIVPIVIRNAEVISARDSTTFNPGTVDVVVYPPIPVDDWTVENLADKIAEVRELYLDTLKDWPHESVPKIGPYARGGGAAKKAPAKKADTAAAAKKATAKATVTKAPARKAAAKKVPAKTTKATATKATAKKTAAKKTAAKKAPAKKAPAKKGRS